MPTTTTLARWNESLESSSSQGSSPSLRCENSAPKSISDLTSPTKTFLLLPSPKKSWEQSYSSFQTLARGQCPRVHYHPWCNDCQTLMRWEQPPPIRQTSARSIKTFGDLKTATREKSRYQSLFRSPRRMQEAVIKVCSTWRDKQFTRAATKRNTKIAAQEALRQSVHQRCMACGVTPPVI